ncbi:MAG: arginyltransferase [Gemmataceae bacterium]|nr:arginyltransferase [Gemmataceae bacterium]
MISLATFLTPPAPCGYLPNQVWQFDYEIVAQLLVEEYEQRLLLGWRRFGRAIFRPRCPGCLACQSLRILVNEYAPDRSQRRNRTRNQDAIHIQVAPPSVTREKLELYDRFHAAQTNRVGWPEVTPKSPTDYMESFVDNPIPTEEWSYFLGDRLVGVGYVDALNAGLSAIYFFHDPEFRDHGLGTWNVQSVIAETRRRGLPHAYLGYMIRGCRSSEYKSRFRPSEVFDLATKTWKPLEADGPAD